MERYQRSAGPDDIHQPWQGASDSSEISVDAARPLVLIADDDPDTCEVCSVYLTWSGFRVAVARDGREAVACARQMLPHVILMDLAMPRMDGWAAIRLLKAEDRTKRIPIIVFTAGRFESGSRERARALGCDGFLAKPCLPEAIELEVRLVLCARDPTWIPELTKTTVTAPTCPRCSSVLRRFESLPWKDIRVDYFVCPTCHREFSLNELTDAPTELPETSWD